jgi:hypothetical protein
MKLLLSIFLSLLSLTAFAQVPEPALLWLKGYGGDGGDQVLKQVTKTADGGFIICIGAGSDPNTGNIDSFCTTPTGVFLKYNPDASILEWSKCSMDGGYIFPVAGGNFVFGGITNTVPSGWAFKILKEDAAGTILWQKTYGGQAASAGLECMAATDDGGYIMAGGTNYTDTDFTTHYGSWMDEDIAIVKVDNNGNKLWTKVVGGTGDESVVSLIAGSSGDFYIVGTTSSNDCDLMGNHGNRDAYIVKLDNNGNIMWHRDLGGTGVERATSAIADGNGGVIVTASTTSTDGDVTHLAQPGENIWAVDIDGDGNIVWNNCYGGGPGDCYPNAICKATDGSIWIAGVVYLKNDEADTIYGNGDAWFVHADAVGNLINGRVLGSSRDDAGTMVYPLSNGNVIAGGYYDAANGVFPGPFYGGDDAFLVQLGPWNQTGVKQELVTADELKIYPNPANDEVNIKTERQQTYGIRIINVVGKTMYQTKLSNSIQVQVSNWPSGVYYVQATGNDGGKVTKKLLVQ